MIFTRLMQRDRRYVTWFEEVRKNYLLDDKYFRQLHFNCNFYSNYLEIFLTSIVNMINIMNLINRVIFNFPPVKH